jgi:hypothetical protein
MASTRAPAVAEVLWELKRVDKIATFAAIALRAGFSAGANGRAMLSCLKSIQQEWPHLQSWRALPDDGSVKKGSEQAKALVAWGATLGDDAEEGWVAVLVDESRIMVWDVEDGEPEDVSAEAPAAE